MTETEDDTDRWKDIVCPWSGRISVVKMNMLPKIIHRYNANPTEASHGIFFFFRPRIKKKKLQSVWRHKRCQITKMILKKKNGAGGIRLPDFRLQN